MVGAFTKHMGHHHKSLSANSFEHLKIYYVFDVKHHQQMAKWRTKRIAYHATNPMGPSGHWLTIPNKYDRIVFDHHYILCFIFHCGNKHTKRPWCSNSREETKKQFHTGFPFYFKLLFFILCVWLCACLNDNSIK